MTLEDLRIFIATVEKGSMSALARERSLTQPAIAHRIRRLEQELQVPLLDRSRNGVRLTEAGSALYDRAVTALAALRFAETEVSAIRERAGRSISIAASSGVVRHTLKLAIQTLCADEDLELRLICSNTLSEQLDALRQRRADLAFVLMWQKHSGFEYRQQTEMSYSLLVHQSDPLARRKTIDLDEIARTRFIRVGEHSTSASYIDDQLSKRGLKLDVAHTVETEGTAVLYVELGLGHAAFPRIQANALETRSELRALPIRNMTPIPLGWAALDFGILPAPAKKLMAHLDELARGSSH